MRALTSSWVAVVTLAACAQPPADGSSSAPSDSASPAASASSSAAPTATNAELEQLARAFVDELAAGKTKEAHRRFSAPLAEKLSQSALEDAWKKSLADLGPYRGIDKLEVGDADSAGKRPVRVRLKLDKGTLDALVGFDAGSPQIAALYFRKPQPTYDPPPYSDSAKFDVREVRVGEGKLALPGALLTPKGDGPFPVVVLVHGSGPNDMDESYGKNRPFRDLAEGLASRSIAVLRYEKRTYGHTAALPMKLEELTMKEEALDDAKAAFELAKAQPRIDPKRVFVAGHSQGGWLMPRMLLDNPDLRGGVSLAGNARHLLDLLVPQYEFLAKLDDGKIGFLESSQIDTVREHVARAKKPDLDPKTPASELPLGSSASYWIYLRDYDAVALAKRATQPMMFMQGERDYQVTAKEDFALWKRELSARKGTDFKLYPKLNHHLIPGEGPSGPAEYERPGHVAPELIEDLARWIDKHR